MIDARFLSASLNASGSCARRNSNDGRPRKRIGEILIERGKLDAAGLERALRLQAESGARASVRCW